MTSNPTIDGVSRELIERAISATIAARGPGSPTEHDLRALLVAPVVERQPVYQVAARLDSTKSAWIDVDKETFDDYAGRGNAWITRVLHTAPPELAELQALNEDAMAVNKTLNQQMDALQATIAKLTAENERLTTQWGDRPAYRTPEYESKRDAMWRRAHMVAVSKGYDHINMAIAAAPTACKDCGGCGGEWQGEEIPNSVCGTCHGSRGKALEAEVERLKGGQGEPRLVSYATDMSTCTLTLGDDTSYIYDRVCTPVPVGFVAHRLDEIGQSYEGVIYAPAILEGAVKQGTLLYTRDNSTSTAEDKS
jgi:hypothetical protein